MMTSVQDVETSVTVTDNSPFQDYPHPDDHTLYDQGGERLGGETSGSERKGVMQWTGSELKSETKRKQYAAKFGDLVELKEQFPIHSLLLFIT